jgi:ABC-2 type transport system ATP-binding protein
MAFAIEVTDVSKHFRLYHEKYTSLKERLIHFGKVPYEDFWALNDINLTIEEGETVGLLGHNGSGKSTLLKCMAGILQPSTGQIRTRGRVAALLELGAGFHPDLTGRENVFMNATLLGLNEKEIAKKFDEIVAFAELEDFIDNQVKFYSSGMYVRLGFAVAVNMDPDILLVDEVLAVGDENFQRKCLNKVRQFQKEGRTIVFVTHGVDQVRQICNRAVVLDHGLQVIDATPGEAIRVFREYLLKKGGAQEEVDQVAPEIELTHGEAQEAKATKTVQITDVQCVRPDTGTKKDDTQTYLLPGDPLDINIDYKAGGVVDDVVFGIAVHDVEGRVVFGWNTTMLGVDIAPLVGEGTITFSFPSIPLLDGDYELTVGAHDRDEGVVYDWHDQKYRFEVMNPGRGAGLVWAPATVTKQERKDAPA